MKDFNALRSCPENQSFTSNDILVVFGEVFDKGYVNGMVEEAKRIGMKVIYGTVGRRDEDGNLRALNQEELSAKKQENLINIPLEAGFDMEPSSKGPSPCDQLKGIKRDDWNEVKLDWEQIEESKKAGQERFVSNVRAFLSEVEKQVSKDQHIHFAHTMAGGIPRAKILMPLLNRVFKGSGKRFLSSKKFWNSEIGRLCSISFDEVTADTFRVLIEESELIRKKAKSTSYSAYGYHGCEPLLNSNYEWQSYAPYLQGWAKIRLENIAKEKWKDGIKAQVFNSPEILTNSSSVFMGVEVCLYPLIRALKFENNGKDCSIHQICADLLKNSEDLASVDTYTQKYMNGDPGQREQEWKEWPQHNTEEQMASMKEASDYLISLHKDKKELMTFPLSEVVFKTTGKVIMSEAAKPSSPVLWLGHDLVAKTHLKYFE